MKQKKPSGEDPVNAKIFNISHYLELYTPNPEDSMTLYKIVSMVYKPIEHEIKKALTRMPTQRIKSCQTKNTYITVSDTS